MAAERAAISLLSSNQPMLRHEMLPHATSGSTRRQLLRDSRNATRSASLRTVVD